MLSQGILTAPLEIREIYQCLGVGALNGVWYDAGHICTHANINPNAKYKPVRHNKREELILADRQSVCYGFGDENSSTDLASRHWVYLRPRVGTDWMRPLDFLNYNHSASNFCSFSLPSTIKGSQVNVVTVNYKALSGGTYNLGIKDIYPTEVFYWGVRIKFIKSGKIIWSTIPLTFELFIILPALFYDLWLQENDGTVIDVTQFFSEERSGKVLAFSTVSPTQGGKALYPVYAPNGEIVTETVDFGGVATPVYVPTDNNYSPQTHFYYEYTNTQWWTTKMRDQVGAGPGRLRSLDAYIVGISSINGEYQRIFEKRIQMDDTTQAVVTLSSTNIYNVQLAFGETFVKDTQVQYYIFFVSRGTTDGQQYVTLTAYYDTKHV